MSMEIGDEYSSSLADLTMNSKPLINMLTILADENSKHAAVIVQSVEKHLDQVRAEIKLPVLYLVDSIIKNVGGAYTQLFSHIIVNMFCKVFKQVDEKTRSQMFKLRETWHDVFPSIKLYQLDVKVSLIDPAWPIQAQPPQSNIHVNPNFFKKSTPNTSGAALMTLEEEEMRNAVHLKEQELLQLQKKKVELELEKAKKLLEQTKSMDKKPLQSTIIPAAVPNSLPSAVVAVPSKPKRPTGHPVVTGNSGVPRIPPVSSSLVNHAIRRDPRLARHNLHASSPLEPVSSQAPNIYDSKTFNKSDKISRYGESSDTPVETMTKVNNKSMSRHITKKDPRLNRNRNSESSTKSSKNSSFKRSRSPIKHDNENRIVESKKEKSSRSPDSSKSISPRSNKLPPIPKLKTKSSNKESSDTSVDSISPSKQRRKEMIRSERAKKSKLMEQKRSKSPTEMSKKLKIKPFKYDMMDVDMLESKSPPATDVTFKELKTSMKDRNYIRRNREKSESPEKINTDLRPTNNLVTIKDKFAESSSTAVVQDVIGNGIAKKDIDLRLISKATDNTTTAVTRKRPSVDKRDSSPVKRSKTEKFDALFGDEDVDLRKLPLDNLTPPPPPIISKESNDDSVVINFDSKDREGGWAKVKEAQSPVGAPAKPLTHLDIVRAKLAEATKIKDGLGRPLLYKSSDDKNKHEQALNFEDTDMRQSSLTGLDKENFDETIKSILSQAEEQYKNGVIGKQQYNILLMQVVQLHETQKLEEAQKKDSLEVSKRRLNMKLKRQNKMDTEVTPISDEDFEGSISPQSDEGDNLQATNYGDIDERVVPPIGNLPGNVSESGKRPPLLPRPDAPYMDSDLRMGPHVPMYDKPDFIPRGPDMRFPGRPMGHRMFGNKGWRGMRPDRGGFRPMAPRGLLPAPMMNARRMPIGGMRMPFEPPMHSQPLIYPPKGPFVGMKQISCPILPYMSDGKNSPPPLGAPSGSRGFVPVDSKVIEYIEQDTMRTIHIDGVAREIRYYDSTAVVMVDWNEPREITFESGHRRISFDDESFTLNLNDDYVNITIDGQPHKIRFGAPTRELFIDDMWFECFFGGVPMPIMLDNKLKHLKLEGPPPQVSVGKLRTDLVAGKINLIVDATTMHPIFLDAKLQKFEIENVVHTLRFVDSLQTVLINEKPFKVEFGGLPKPLFVGKRKHFVRFSILPKNITAGCVHIKNMEGKRPAILPTPIDATPTSTLSLSSDEDKLQSSLNNTSNSIKETTKIDSNVKGGLDMLASVMPSSMAPASQYAGYSIAESNKPVQNDKPVTIPGLEQQDMSVPPPNITSLLSNINVNDLFAKLVASGIVSTLPSVTAQQPAETNKPTTAPNTKPMEKNLVKNSSTTIKPVDIMKSETLKARQPGLISLLHTGMQCGSCGARFPPEHTVRYSQHLDWHFRQNRADRHSQRRPNSRRWYYDISDWVQYQEIEDLEEREKNWFEREQQAAEAAKSEEAAATAARRETSSVPLLSGAPPEYLRCYLCHDNFHQFYNHDTDEWHLRNAVEFEGNNYHPICLDDHKASLIAKDQEKTSVDDIKDENSIVEDKESSDVVAIENEEDEDISNKDVEMPDEVVPEDSIERDNESIVEVLSEEAITQESTTDEAPDVEVVEEDDDVVIKNEPIEQIVVDDVDTDEETENERRARDIQQEAQIDFSKVKIKQEPIDPDDEPIITSEGVMTAQADTTHAAVLSSIDGNVQLEPTVQSAPIIPAGGIRINITKPISQLSKEKDALVPKIAEEIIDEPSPPGEEPEMTYKLKPSLEGITFSVQPPMQRGSELSGLCSIM